MTVGDAVRGLRRLPWWRVCTFAAVCVCVYFVGADTRTLFDDLGQMPRRPLPYSILATFTVLHGAFMAWVGRFNWRAYRREGRR